MKNIINSLLRLVGIKKKEVGNTLTLTILAEDIRTTCYMHSEDCAITRALARAGRADLKDAGTSIRFKKDYFADRLTDFRNDSYSTLVKKVERMYYGGEDVKDFTHTLVY